LLVTAVAKVDLIVEHAHFAKVVAEFMASGHQAGVIGAGVIENEDFGDPVPGLRFDAAQDLGDGRRGMVTDDENADARVVMRPAVRNSALRRRRKLLWRTVPLAHVEATPSWDRWRSSLNDPPPAQLTRFNLPEKHTCTAETGSRLRRREENRRLEM